ncbi:MAG: nucleotide exchange factor GrpE [Parcubacteria group bacterium]
MKEENDDIVIEDDPDLAASTEALKKLREKLKEAEAKAKEYLDGWQRAQADFANLRRRDEEAKIEFLKFAQHGLIEELIPVLDSFNIAKSGGHKEIEPVFKQFWGILKGKGLEELNPLGKAFDPKYHEAIGTVAVEKAEDDHKILEVVQKGYIMSGKIIRPAKVKLGTHNG